MLIYYEDIKYVCYLTNLFCKNHEKIIIVITEYSYEILYQEKNGIFTWNNNYSFSIKAQVYCANLIIIHKIIIELIYHII